MTLLTSPILAAFDGGTATENHSVQMAGPATSHRLEAAEACLLSMNIRRRIRMHSGDARIMHERERAVPSIRAIFVTERGLAVRREVSLASQCKGTRRGVLRSLITDLGGVGRNSALRLAEYLLGCAGKVTGVADVTIPRTPGSRRPPAPPR